MIRNGVAQRRVRAVPPVGERRSDIDIVFDLAARLGLGAHFSGGDAAAAFDAVLEPAGLSWDGLLAHPHGVRVVPQTVYEKHAREDAGGRFAGLPTLTRKVELFSDPLASIGQDGLPRYVEPAMSPVSRPDLAREFPLVLTNAKRAHFLHSQHRGIAALRRIEPDPTVELHPDTAAQFGVVDGAWVLVETPRGSVHAKADVTRRVARGVVCGSHGWWEAQEELGRAPLDPFSERGANLNLLVHNDERDPISGGVPHRSTLCRVVPSEGPVGYAR